MNARRPGSGGRFFRAALAAVAALLAAHAAGAEGPAEPPAPVAAGAAVGDPAPDWELTDLDGRAHRLAEARGRVVFLDFWATWCFPCIESMPALEELRARYADRGVVFYSVHCKEDADPRETYLATGASIPLLLGGDEVASRYGVGNLPAYAVIDRRGRVAFRGTGFGPRAPAILDRAIREALESGAGDEAEVGSP